MLIWARTQYPTTSSCSSRSGQLAAAAGHTRLDGDCHLHRSLNSSIIFKVPFQLSQFRLYWGRDTSACSCAVPEPPVFADLPADCALAAATWSLPDTRRSPGHARRRPCLHTHAPVQATMASRACSCCCCLSAFLFVRSSRMQSSPTTHPDHADLMK